MAQNQKKSGFKICPTCGKEFKRRRFNGRLEDYTRFNKRIYCSKSCSALRDRIIIGVRTQNRRLRTLYLNEHCEECGTQRNLQIHHKDENWKNNDPNNISTLCGHCHMTLHWDLWKSRKNTKHYNKKKVCAS